MDEPAVSSNEQHGAPRGNNPAGGADNAQEVVDRARAHRAAELAAQYQARQLTPVRPTTSVGDITTGVTRPGGAGLCHDDHHMKPNIKPEDGGSVMGLRPRGGLRPVVINRR